MSVDKLLDSLNRNQRIAATFGNQHALVLAGAGTGKTKTIVARAAYLISQGVPAHRVAILTFTRKAAAEIVERVKSTIGESAGGLRASTFHMWCMSIMHRMPDAFGTRGFSIIDRDDQLLLFKVVRGNTNIRAKDFLSAAMLCDVYSLARNTGKNLSTTLERLHPDALRDKAEIAEVMREYELRKQSRKYLDYDDILDVVAQRLIQSPETRDWITSQYDHFLVDEMQDTNPLQWKLLDPLKEKCILFCVGDDAQSIYGFRGADFRNVHSFSERVPGATIFKLTDNYRSTQEILDVSNWLLNSSPLDYDKRLIAARGVGQRPQLHIFPNEWEEATWVTQDINRRKNDGDNWGDHMVLARSAYVARHVESSLISAEIPYRFIGGTKLFESAHVRDVLSLLRVIGNHTDEIAWMRYLMLFPGVGEKTASGAVSEVLETASLKDAITSLRTDSKLLTEAAAIISDIAKLDCNVANAIGASVNALSTILESNYKNQEWDKRRRDFPLLQKIAEKHTSILSFVEEYLLDPITVTQISSDDTPDAVTLITVHSAKGTECKTCYVSLLQNSKSQKARLNYSPTPERFFVATAATSAVSYPDGL
jgi:DNA helicase-2/ATP-dependent DNA helicase PcrA